MYWSAFVCADVLSLTDAHHPSAQTNPDLSGSTSDSAAAHRPAVLTYRSAAHSGVHKDAFFVMTLLSKMQPANHSDDETDVEGPRRRNRERRFRIIESEWMSKAFRSFLRKLYDAYIYDWETLPGDSKQGGSNPRERYVGNPPESTLGRPAIGLWRNCYNEKWLATLKPHKYRELEIIEKPYDFTIREPGVESQPEFVQGSSRP